MFFYVFFEKSIFSRFPYQLYTRTHVGTRLNDLKFEIPTFFWGGTHRAPPEGLTEPLPDFSPASLRPRFELRPQISAVLGLWENQSGGVYFSGGSMQTWGNQEAPEEGNPPPPPTNRALNLGRFVPSIRASPDSDSRFPNF